MSIVALPRTPVLPVLPPPRAVAEPAMPGDSATRLLEGLNREQRCAVTHGEGPLVVIAGPGTGKTEVVTRRIAWLIAAKKSLPREILGLTFTDNAAQEMQARVDMLVPYGQADTHVQTFHAFGDRTLREFSLELGLPGDVRLLSRRELVVLLGEHLFELGLERYRPLGDPTRFLEALVELFLRAKDEDVTVDALADHAAGLLASSESAAGEERAALADLAAARTEIATAFRRYGELLAARDCIDHADQIALPLRLLRERPAVRAALARRYRYVLVDELQDTNRAQLDLVLELTGSAGNVTVVGDADQGIYGFRGAATGNVERFAMTVASPRTVVLRRNYRSRRPIIEAAGRLLGHARVEHSSPVAQLAQRRSRRPRPVQCRAFVNFAQEADAIAGEIARRVEAGERPSDFAVLTRSNGETEAVRRSLRAHGVAVGEPSRSGLFDDPFARALVAFLRVVADPWADLELYCLATAAPYGLEQVALARLLRAARQGHQPLWDTLCAAVDDKDALLLPAAAAPPAALLVQHVRAAMADAAERTSGDVLYRYVRQSGLLGRLALPAAGADGRGARAVARLFELVQRRAELLAVDRVAFLVPHLGPEEAGRDDGTDTDPFDDRVSVLTVHRAKGLEFKVVYICGLVDGRFPVRARPPALALPAELLSRSASQEDDHLQEERRLFYVALTRGRDEVHLSYHTTTANGRGRCRPSPFIAEALDLPVITGEPAPSSTPLEQMARLDSVAPPTAEAVPRPGDGPMSLSFSQVDDYLSCPERYRLRHVVGLPTPAHHALAYGIAMHSAVAAFHVSQACGEPLGEEQLLAEFGQAWRSEGFLSREHEDARFAAGQDALRRFRTQQLLAVQAAPVAVERPFTFRLGIDIVRGRIDRLDGTVDGLVITDYKTSDVRDQRRADAKARESLQLQVYAMATASEVGHLPAEMRLQFLDSGLIGHTRPDVARLEKARQTLNSAAAGIREGRFVAKPNAVACGYCPYRTICSSSAA